MNVVRQIQKWEQPRHNALFLALRIALGLVIIGKGIIFLEDFEHLHSLLQHSRFRSGTSFWVYYIGFAHLMGGIFIIIGLLTRVAALLQVPVLAGAVFFVNPFPGMFIINGEFLLSFLVLCMLFYFLAKGSGNFSMDAYLKSHFL